MDILRVAALQAVLEPDASTKAARAEALSGAMAVDAAQVIEAPPGVPGRPERPELVASHQLTKRSMHTAAGRAALIHALAHIELNAIDLACDIVWRFAGMPADFYRQWAQVAREEAQHFLLLQAHLRGMGYDYGDFPAHHGLWQMAERTQRDLLGRLALVPRTLEARGLDASPPIKAKLVASGDLRGAEIVAIILRDEVGHVAVGNYWYGWLCAQRQLDPITT